MPAGTQTRPVPIAGNSDATAAQRAPHDRLADAEDPEADAAEHALHQRDARRCRAACRRRPRGTRASARASRRRGSGSMRDDEARQRRPFEQQVVRRDRREDDDERQPCDVAASRPADDVGQVRDRRVAVAPAACFMTPSGDCPRDAAAASRARACSHCSDRRRVVRRRRRSDRCSSSAHDEVAHERRRAPRPSATVTKLIAAASRRGCWP